MIACRAATPADAATLSALGKASFIETFGHLYSADDLNAFLDTHAPGKWARLLADPAMDVRIAEVDGQAIGYARIGPLELPVKDAEEGAWELKQLYVLKPWQGAGVAAALMDWVMAQARLRGGDALYLSVYSDNLRAQHFYRRYGFAFVQPYAFMVGEQADEDQIWRAQL